MIIDQIRVYPCNPCTNYTRNLPQTSICVRGAKSNQTICAIIPGERARIRSPGPQIAAWTLTLPMTSKSSKTVQHKSTKSGSKNGRRGGQTSKAAQSKGKAAKSPLKLPFRRAKRRSSPVVQPRQSRQQASPPSPAVRQGMSLDRKLDIIGIFLVLVGLLTGLSLLSATNSPLTGSWVSGLRKAFGLGAYLFPGTLIVAGLWLVLRNFERIPRLGLERLLGIGLLFFNILAGLHFLMLHSGETSSQELAQSGGGGGYTGALIYQALVAVLGTGGAAVALLAWLMIALLLILDVTVLEIAPPAFPVVAAAARWGGGHVAGFQDWLPARRH